MVRRSEYSGPDKEKHRPLDKEPTKKLIQTAIDHPDPLDTVCVRVPLSTGLRNDELVHLRPNHIGRDYNEDYDRVAWYVRIPGFAECIGGNSDAKQGNAKGSNLHTKGDPCSKCCDRSVDEKDWLTEEQKNRPGFSPKTSGSRERYQWFLPGRADLASTLENIIEAHDQFPILHGAVNRRIQKLADKAGIDRRVTAHCLRHTYGCKLGASEKFNLNRIMTYMRHSDPDMAHWYSEQWGERRRAALADYEDEFSS
ncbi:tyrosine-type recombinase/integrase (plasmid) [Halobacterium salinarum]|jgi:integrase|uniref:tyrosine-type recombinase/integrase n=1 Tax=Halobacterium salinarum TaxID=2242 RepID=UPI0030D2EDDB